MVLTARSTCDARYDMREIFGGAAEVAEEKITVRLASGSVLRANRIAIGTDGADLAVLQVKGVPHGAATTTAKLFRFVDQVPETDLKLFATGKRGVAQASQALSLEEPGRLSSGQGGAVLHAGAIVGILARKAADDATATVVLLVSLPEPLRPGQ